ncbi:hypothetical protein QBC37DRAFT_453706 [Rhypophila decipiens]|uniref:Transmembrane protein n=1 Tax=Rhypophila decipiens TaxID=261697 RepID=A0AAN6XWH1_9PEZI|nr:hypothetical protein QBC37DRAFT_453706 [Rhypophila decipiens]
MLYITLSLVMIFRVDGYLTDDDAKSHFMSQGRFKLQSSDVITLVAVGTMVTGWVAGMWSSSVVAKSGYVIWLSNKDEQEQDQGMKRTIDRLRWTMDRRLPVKLDRRVDYTLIRISLLLVFPVIFAPPLLQGSLSWKSSSEAAGLSHVGSGNPGAVFWRWNWPVARDPADTVSNDMDVSWAAGWLAGITWDNITHEGTKAVPTCRHVISHTQFPIGSRIFNTIIPCITVHSISWPDPAATNTTPGHIPPDIRNVLDYPGLVSAANPDSVGLFGDAASMAVFDPTNKTLPTPPVLNHDPHGDPNLIISSDPIYPSPFLWSGVMNILVVLNRTLVFPPYENELFGPLNDTHNKFIIPSGGTISYTTGKVYPERYTAYHRINFTAGVINASSATYVRSTVIEADPHNTPTVAHPWVREALWLLSDVINIMAKFNSTWAIPTWGDVEGYAATAIRFGYMAAWTSLHRKLQAVVSLWRVLLWLGINVLFSASWVVSRVLTGRHEVIRG